MRKTENDWIFEFEKGTQKYRFSAGRLYGKSMNAYDYNKIESGDFVYALKFSSIDERLKEIELFNYELSDTFIKKTLAEESKFGGSVETYINNVLTEILIEFPKKTSYNFPVEASKNIEKIMVHFFDAFRESRYPKFPFL